MSSKCHTINATTTETLYFRVSADVTNVFQQYTAWSPVFSVDAVDPITAPECEAAVGALQSAQDNYDALLLSSGDMESAQAEMITALLAESNVAAAGPATDGYGVWVQFANGTLGAVGLSPDNLRAGGSLETTSAAATKKVNIGSKRAYVLSPFESEWGDLDEGPIVGDMLKDIGCPYFELGKFKNSNANLYRFRNMSTAGVIGISTHGEALFRDLSPEAREAYRWEHDGSQELLWTGEAVDCSLLLQTSPSCSADGETCGTGGAGECVVGSSNYCVDHKQADLRNGRIVFGPDGYGILPSFVKHHGQRRAFPKSLINLGSCRSMFNGPLASMFFGMGAQAILGFSDYVTKEFAFESGSAFFDTLINEAKTTGVAYDSLDTVEDPDNPGTEYRLFGAPTLYTSDANVINASFETGDTTAWTRDGDGRVISALGATIPVDGKFMGLISTGLGFTAQVGELKQKFCIAQDKTQASIYWKFFSEEFLEWCGSSFQDGFTAKLQNTSNVVTITDVNIDGLCPPSQCGGCGGDAAQYGVTLVPSDVSFDQGGVYNGSWILSTANVTPLAGQGPVTMTYFATDVGDSIYDTVILVDDLRFE